MDDEIFKEDIPGEKISASSSEKSLEQEGVDQVVLGEKKAGARYKSRASKRGKKEKKKSTSKKKISSEEISMAEESKEGSREEDLEPVSGQTEQPEFVEEQGGETYKEEEMSASPDEGSLEGEKEVKVEGDELKEEIILEEEADVAETIEGIFGESELGKEEEEALESSEEEISTEELLENISPLEEEPLEEPIELEEEDIGEIEPDEEKRLEEELMEQTGEEEIKSEEGKKLVQEKERPLFEEETLDLTSSSSSPPDFKTEDLESLMDPAEKEKEEIERFLEALKREREEKRKQAEKTTGLPPWTSDLKEREKEVEASFPEEEKAAPFVEEETVESPEGMSSQEEEQPLFPLTEEPSSTETIGLPETVTKTGFSFAEYEEKKSPKREFFRSILEISWLKALAFDFFFIAIFWLVAVVVTSVILKVNFISLVLATPWKMLALYLSFLGVYFLLFLIFIGETLGRQLFPSTEE